MALEYGMSADEYWFGDPNMLFAFQKAYQEKEKLKIKGYWLQGQYVACAIKSTISFSGKTVPYPDAPFGDEDEQELAKDDNWLQAQRLKAFEHFKAILGKNKK